jgi:hypothetical protein
MLSKRINPVKALANIEERTCLTDGRGKAGSCSASADCGPTEALVIRELLFSIQENEEFLIIVSLSGTQGFDVQITTQVAEYCAPSPATGLPYLSSNIDFILN